MQLEILTTVKMLESETEFKSNVKQVYIFFYYDHQTQIHLVNNIVKLLKTCTELVSSGRRTR